MFLFFSRIVLNSFILSLTFSFSSLSRVGGGGGNLDSSFDKEFMSFII